MAGAASIVSAVLAVLANTAMAQDATVRIAVEGAFPPFNYLDAHGKLQGFDVEIAGALCDTARLRCEYVVQGWEDMIPGLVAERYDAIVSSMSMSSERREKVDFTERYYDSPSIFVARKDSPIKAVDPEALRGLRIGVTVAAAQASFVERFYKPSSEVIFFQVTAELYKGLEDGSVDVILEDKLAIFDWLTNTKSGSCCEFKGSDIVDKVFFGEGAGIALRKDDDALRERLDTAIAEIMANGTYDEINAKYFPFSIR